MAIFTAMVYINEVFIVGQSINKAEVKIIVLVIMAVDIFAARAGDVHVACDIVLIHGLWSFCCSLLFFRG